MTVRSFHSHTQRNYVRVVSKLAAFSWPLARAAGRRICEGFLLHAYDYEPLPQRRPAA